jgi:hypothetical protein
MALSRSDRFKLKSRMLDVMDAQDSKWTFQRKNLLLSEFNLATLSDNWSDPSFEETIANVSDAILIEMYSLIAEIPINEVDHGFATDEHSNWKAGYVRLFITHSAVHKKFVGAVANELAVVGIHGFVAHDTMTVSKPWQTQIEHALNSMQAFVALVHPEFCGSAWCQQEVGWALGRRIPYYAIRMGTDPNGFIGREQWPSGLDLKAKAVASQLAAWISSIEELGQTMVDGLFAALESAGNYIDAGATAERIAALTSLSEEQFANLDLIYWNNDQVHTGVLPKRALEPFYRKHGRSWPPPKAGAPATSRNGLSRVASGWSDEVPF